MVVEQFCVGEVLPLCGGGGGAGVVIARVGPGGVEGRHVVTLQVVPPLHILLHLPRRLWPRLCNGNVKIKYS